MAVFIRPYMSIGLCAEKYVKSIDKSEDSSFFVSYDISLYLELCNLLQRTDKNLN